MDRKTIYDKLSEMSLELPTDRNDILAKRFGAPMKKMTYRDMCIDYVKKTMPCTGYRDYVVAELKKLEQIEQIIESRDGFYLYDNFPPFQQIKEVIENEQ